MIILSLFCKKRIASIRMIISIKCPCFGIDTDSYCNHSKIIAIHYYAVSLRSFFTFNYSRNRD